MNDGSRPIWRDFHLISPREPRLPIESCGHPNTIDMISQLGTAMGFDLPALDATPEQVWSGLLDEVEKRFKENIESPMPAEPTMNLVSPEKRGLFSRRSTGY